MRRGRGEDGEARGASELDGIAPHGGATSPDEDRLAPSDDDGLDGRVGKREVVFAEKGVGRRGDAQREDAGFGEGYVRGDVARHSRFDEHVFLEAALFVFAGSGPQGHGEDAVVGLEACGGVGARGDDGAGGVFA